MGKELTVVYVETSAINYLLDNYADEEIIFIRDCLKAITHGKICLSPVTFWEIACTGDSYRKDDLIRMCKLFFDNVTLFPDPIQVLDIYLEQGCPTVQTQESFFDCCGSFDEVWKSTAPDLERTYRVEGYLIKEDKAIVKQISAIIQKLAKNDFSYSENEEDQYYKLICDEINRAYSQFHFVQEQLEKGVISENYRIHKLTIFFAYMLLILGISVGNTSIIPYWEGKGIKDTKCQICYMLTKDETLFHRGPLVYMAMMALAQIEHGTNRGLYKDCLHAMYMPYCNSFLSNDQHFLQLKEQEPHELWGRITSIKSFCDELFNKILPEFIEENGE